jgi:hypothetical protein
MKTLLAVVLMFFAARGIAASNELSKSLYVQVILGTDKPCPNCHEVGPKLSKKLSPVFRWKHYWELERRKVSIQPKGTTRVELARDRRIEITLVKADQVEVRLYRRSGLVTKTRHTLGGQMSILGGEEETRESFFVVVRGDEPKND